MNSTTSGLISVLRYDVDKGLNFVLEFGIHPSLIFKIKVEREIFQVLNKGLPSCCKGTCSTMYIKGCMYRLSVIKDRVDMLKSIKCKTYSYHN